MRSLTKPDNFVSYNLHRIHRRRRRVLRGLQTYIGQPLVGAKWKEFIGELRQLLDPTIHPSVLEMSMQELPGTQPTEEVLRRTVSRLSANLERLQAGTPVPTWQGQATCEWVPVQVTAAYQYKHREKDSFMMCQCRVLAGSPVGEYINKRWSVTSLFWIAKHLGFNPRKPEMKLLQVREIVTCRFYALLDPDKYQRALGFERIYPSSACLKWNRELIRKRHRVDFTCPANFSHDCFMCAVGYSKCDLATHAEDYVRGLCHKCGQEHLMDPAVSLTVCIACYFHSH